MSRIEFAPISSVPSPEGEPSGRAPGMSTHRPYAQEPYAALVGHAPKRRGRTRGHIFPPEVGNGDDHDAAAGRCRRRCVLSECRRGSQDKGAEQESSGAKSSSRRAFHGICPLTVPELFASPLRLHVLADAHGPSVGDVVALGRPVAGCGTCVADPVAGPCLRLLKAAPRARNQETRGRAFTLTALSAPDRKYGDVITGGSTRFRTLRRRGARPRRPG